MLELLAHFLTDFGNKYQLNIRDILFCELGSPETSINIFLWEYVLIGSRDWGLGDYTSIIRPTLFDSRCYPQQKGAYATHQTARPALVDSRASLFYPVPIYTAYKDKNQPR